MTNLLHSPVVPGFPEITQPTPQCKLCTLAASAPGLLKLMHAARRDEDLGNDALATRMRGAFERHGHMVPSPRAIGRHFSGHVDFAAVPAVGDFDMPDPMQVTFERLAGAEQDLTALRPEDIALGRNDSDYHSMADLFRRLMRRIASLDSDPYAFVNDDGKPSLQKLSIWSNMISGAKSIIEGLNKMRNSDRMTASILEQHTKRYATALAAPLADTIRGVRDGLRTVDDPRVRALEQRLTVLLESGVGDMFTEAAASALRETKEQYKLLH